MAGSGIADLDLSGIFSEEQVLALFGEGLRPNANAFIAERIAAGSSFEKARAQARLGRRFAQYDNEIPSGQEIGRGLRPVRARPPARGHHP